jgi:isoamylase
MSPGTPRGADTPPAPGLTLRDGGADVCVFAAHADGVELCLFEPGDATGQSERRIELTERLHGHWFAFVPGLRAGQRYGLRVRGPWSPPEGLRHNRAKLLLDPYAQAIEGEVTWRPEVFGHLTRPDLTAWDAHTPDDADSAPFVPRAVVVGHDFDWGQDRHPARLLSETVVYEAHVRNLTMRLPQVPEPLRGTYAGLAHPATVERLSSLGITAVELLPVQAFTSEPQLQRRGLRNHWGYNTLGYFAPHPRYAAATEPQHVVDEFKQMVKALHAAGIEVLLDVVYNHTCEQSFTGPMLSWRGLDNRTYYRLDGRGEDIDVTGCGNTLDVREVATCRMILDSLRYWVTHYHVDGFRFDLAVALARGRGDDFDPNHPLMVGMRTDPVLSQVKNIVEPWDLGIQGWRTGQFPPPFSEWNDRYRDRVRSFWLTDLAGEMAGHPGHGVQDLATRLAGSADLFHNGDRATLASVNFVAAHDGFTTADLTMYSRKHNERNGEGNRDGTSNNNSWNHGVEGPIDNELAALRRRSMRNLTATLLVSTGMPMLLAGDEVGNSQHGNNNAYCQDSELSWIDWDLAPWQEDLLATTRFLVALRAGYPVLRQRAFFSGSPVNLDGSKDLEWYAVDGTPMTMQRWGDRAGRTLQMYLNGAWQGHDSVLVVLHGGMHDVTVTLPRPPGITAYELLWDSTWERPPRGRTPVRLVKPQPMAPASLRIYRALDAD